MRNRGIRIYFNAIAFLALLAGTLLWELQFHIFERSVGLYLKWQNPKRSQLGRVWDRDRQNILAQRKIQSLLTNLDTRKQTTESIQSIDQIFETLFSGNSQVITREKFLKLYYNYPGEWSWRMVSPLDLIEIDSKKNWSRVVFNRMGAWVTIGFIDRENLPIREFHVSLTQLNEVQSNRLISRGTLEEMGFSEDRLFAFEKFVPILKSLDPDSRKSFFPDPQWFLERDFHVTRIGFSDSQLSEKGIPRMLVGLEYQTDFYPHVLQIKVPNETGLNILSQIEKGNLESMFPNTGEFYEKSQDGEF